MPRKMAKQMTPAQYMKSHYVTRELQRLGVTDEQLQNMRFSGKNRNDPFERWSFWFDGPADGPSPLVKAYCALKWLILEGPPASREREDAWRLGGEGPSAGPSNQNDHRSKGSFRFFPVKRMLFSCLFVTPSRLSSRVT